MSGFGDEFDQPEVDPAAEFLAREQDNLAGLEDEVKPAAISVPPTIINGDEAPNSVGSFEMIDGIVEPDTISVKKDSSHDDYYSNIENDVYEASPSPPPLNREVREEPEKIKKWREDQIQRLEEKDEEEERKKVELKEIAKKELEDWYKNHEEAIAKTKAANRNAEKQFVAEDDDIEPGTEWERIAKLCDFNPKAKQGSKDVSRMRSIILQMKQSPITVNSKA